jgi:hypothetical protein
MGWGDVRYCFARAILVIIIIASPRPLSIIIRNGAKTISSQTSFGNLIIIIIIIRNGAKTISLHTSFVDLIIIIRNGAKTISSQTLFGNLIIIIFFFFIEINK